MGTTLAVGAPPRVELATTQALVNAPKAFAWARSGDLEAYVRAPRSRYSESVRFGGQFAKMQIPVGSIVAYGIGLLPDEEERFVLVRGVASVEPREAVLPGLEFFLCDYPYQTALSIRTRVEVRMLAGLGDISEGRVFRVKSGSPLVLVAGWTGRYGVSGASGLPPAGTASLNGWSVGGPTIHAPRSLPGVKFQLSGTVTSQWQMLRGDGTLSALKSGQVTRNFNYYIPLLGPAAVSAAPVDTSVVSVLPHDWALWLSMERLVAPARVARQVV